MGVFVLNIKTWWPPPPPPPPSPTNHGNIEGGWRKKMYKTNEKSFSKADSVFLICAYNERKLSFKLWNFFFFFKLSQRTQKTINYPIVCFLFYCILSKLIKGLYSIEKEVSILYKDWVSKSVFIRVKSKKKDKFILSPQYSEINCDSTPLKWIYCLCWNLKQKRI